MLCLLEAALLLKKLLYFTQGKSQPRASLQQKLQLLQTQQVHPGGCPWPSTGSYFIIKLKQLLSLLCFHPETLQTPLSFSQLVKLKPKL